MQMYLPKHPKCRLRFHSHCKIWLQESRFVKVSLERKGPDPVTEDPVTPSSSGTSEREASVIDKDVLILIHNISDSLRTTILSRA